MKNEDVSCSDVKCAIFTLWAFLIVLLCAHINTGYVCNVNAWNSGIQESCYVTDVMTFSHSSGGASEHDFRFVDERSQVHQQRHNMQAGETLYSAGDGVACRPLVKKKHKKARCVAIYHPVAKDMQRETIWLVILFASPVVLSAVCVIFFYKSNKNPAPDF
jgi:hypothetical protein